MAASLSRRASLALLLSAICPASVDAGGVRIVGPYGSQNFASLQAAIDAAVDGDVLLVGAGVYPGFNLDKNLSIAAVPGATVQVNGTTTVHNLQKTGVLLSGLTITGSLAQFGLTITDNSAQVRVQDCSITGGGPVLAVGGGGVRLINNAGVTLTRCTVYGGSPHANSYVPGIGLYADGTVLALFDSNIAGSVGLGGYGIGEDGGAGMQVLAGSLYLAGTTVKGGPGGYNSNGNGGWGGDGLFAVPGAMLLDCVVQGGAGGTGIHGNDGHPGTAFTGGPHAFYLGKARKIDAVRVSSDQMSLGIFASGVAGDRIFLLASAFYAHVDAPAYSSVWMIPPLQFLPRIAPFAIPTTSSSVVIPFRMADLPAHLIAQPMVIQGLFVDQQGTPILSSPMHVVRLNRDEGPDCNVDLIQDYVDVIEGLTPDANSNVIPDVCEVPWTRYVDAQAPPGGNGSAQSPFNTLRQAFNIAQSGDTVMIADGLYYGPDNRDLDFVGRTLAVQSANGPVGCIIDCEGLGRAFVLNHGEPPQARIEGLTIAHGDASAAGGDYGGGILADGASPTISNCIVSACRAPIGGGGIALIDSNGIVRGTTLSENAVTLPSSVLPRGGGAMLLANGGAGAAECRVQSNSSVNGGGGISLTGNPASEQPTFVCNCNVLGNSAPTGGGLLVEGDLDRAIVSGLWISGNTAQRGGAIATRGTTLFTLASSTVTANASADPGSVIDARPGAGGFTGDVRIRASILWGNPAPSNKQILMSGSGAVVTVDVSDVERGIQSVRLADGAALVWAPSNINLDPLFVAPDGPDLDPLTLDDNDDRLAPASPCIDSCDYSFLELDRLDLDGDGDPFEKIPYDLDRHARVIDLPSVPNTGSGFLPWLDYGAYEREP